MKQIVKRQGHYETYDGRKLYASVYAACLSVRVPAMEAEIVAAEVTEYVQGKIESRSEIPSSLILNTTAAYLDGINPDAAYMYRTHRNLC